MLRSAMAVRTLLREDRGMRGERGPWADFHSAVSDPAPCVARLVAVLRPCAGKRVLDLGCGAGRNVGSLLEAGLRVTAVDLDAQALAAARAREDCCGADLRVMSMTRLELPTASFDGVLAV